MLKKIFVSGIVQGVGFRPFVYNIAKKNNLKGYVKNKGNFVEIVVNGNLKDINNFLINLKEEKPVLSKINKLEIEDIDTNNDLDNDLNNKLDGLEELNKEFHIYSSQNVNNEVAGTIPPDIALCDDCIKELKDKKDIRYEYPFIACVNCGPRFTVIKKLPYDRENTSMDKFPLCENCEKEYKNPNDRRFHAQANCCDKCGPKVFLTDSNGNKLLEKESAIKKAVELLEDGKILAIKGIGGTHLVCDANNDDAILELRKRLNRPTQAFAIMSTEEKYPLFSKFTKIEEEALNSYRRPIVALKKKENGYNKYISENISNLDTVGVMLPYSGLHYLLFGKCTAYVMTSANLPGLPMAITNDKIIESLKDIADYFLLHNRDIVNRCDDSVLKLISNRMMILRRSRGYAPEPIEIDFSKMAEFENKNKYKNKDENENENKEIINELNNKKIEKNIISVGAELNSVACLTKGNKFYMTQYIGNTSKYETYNYLKDAVHNILRLTNTNKLDTIVCDLHPQFNSKKFANELTKEYDAPMFEIQHHAAHVYSLMGDNGFFEPNITIALDGLGYGKDGNIWGGELLYCDKNYEIHRIGHLEEQLQLGGDLSTKYPLRMLFSILSKKMSLDESFEFVKKYIGKYPELTEKELKLIKMQIKSGLNTAITTSTGRVLDSVAALLSVCFKKTYDGEPSIRLEAFANSCDEKEKKQILEFVENMDNIRYSRLIDYENNIIKTSEIVYDCYTLLQNEVFSKKGIAYYAHLVLANCLCIISENSAKKLNINTLGLTGGVSYNRIITEYMVIKLKNKGFNILLHNNVPNGDGGIAFGQSVGYILKNEIN
ncbi:carbamoyltransferase HypF [Methanococcus voltae]|uniref:Carbamoyltransferase n=1 Tax=Methanococcus voltae (strain ATCC BAA-1334 / A3) TaxID=456320 RepID=D7DUS4_METV3|nr:carbamoyltransferase HypF [Methanococcus voltae]MCS3900686.1 hydrogenase maturation protein HypF [Methanococcus voltae]